jgi:hypothetical protein
VTELVVKRTLVKSPPELWAELSDVETLARLLDQSFGRIRITRADPESSFDWSGARANGSVELRVSGWGTRVRITASLDRTVEPAGAERALESVLDEVGTAHHRPFSR